ncbi:acyl-CoA thioesterase [Micrococcales bacterium 31B]|nr:acyl-CoA thioesterase [Micrococcales bacterium 31B]
MTNSPTLASTRRVDPDRDLHGISHARISRRVEWVDTDASGHHHNSLILRWAEAAESELFLGLGLRHYFPAAPRVRQEVNYRAPIHFGDEVETVLWVEHLRGRSLTLRFETRLAAAPGTRVADGAIVTVHVPPGAAASASWPSDILATLRARTDHLPTGEARSHGPR